MKGFFYPRIALVNLKNNYRFIIPRILSSAGLLACFYISVTLMLDKRLGNVKGGEFIPTFMAMGAAVLAILSAVIVFYVNSFLMKQRKQELGLYNVLGMEKRHIGKVLFFEALFSSISSIILGLLFGLIFYKLCSILISRLLGAEIIAGFYYFSLETVLKSGGFFVFLDVLCFIYNIVTIGRMKPVELLESRQTGEKEPRVKWIMLVLGAVSLASGYYISITTTAPLEALNKFFLAVILVIFGTYFLFVSGSIFILKCLKKNKKYYYEKNHMPSVSGLIYRMKQNAVGLASIAILATGVLIMISTTVSLYTGMEEALRINYPFDCEVSGVYYTYNEETGYYDCHQIPDEVIDGFINSAAEENGLTIKKEETANYLEVGYLVDGNSFETQKNDGFLDYSLENLTVISFVTEEEYLRQTGVTLGLLDGEIAFSNCEARKKYTEDTLSVAGVTYKIAKTLEEFPIRSTLTSTTTCYGVVVADQSTLELIYEAQRSAYGRHASEYSRRIKLYFTDYDAILERGENFNSSYMSMLRNYLENEDISDFSISSNDSIWEARDSFFGMYGTLLFLGILLGTVCMFSTVLIIYYKQISEGYEDRERFQIMEKIGMSSAEVKKTINSQVVLVFFAPLIVAGIHIIFAYPLLERMLHILGLIRSTLFLECVIIVFVIFSLLYILIYKATARTYYKIVH